MMITRDNYESFFLDYLEGNLDERLIDQFLDFLEKNPDLKEELHLFENIQLPQEKTVFRQKEILYKPSLAENESFELKAVAYMEGDLKDKERLAFTATLDRNPALQKEYSLFEKTRLAADTTIRYPRKNKLYRKSGTVVWLNWSARAAAILVLLMGIYTLFQTGEDPKAIKITNEVALVKEPVVSPQEALNGKEKEYLGQETGDKGGETEDNRNIIGHRKQKTEKKRQKTQDSKLNTEHWQLPAEPLETIRPIMARLQQEPEQLALAVSSTTPINKINGSRNVVTLDEYIATKAKKATNEGILSVNRILRVGLNVASELSGDRLGYTVKNGKVASVDFESKLLAFELPLEKK